MLNADDDLPIEAGVITRTINGSQKKVESHNFDLRKHVLQYDDVLNTQREVIYRERRQILEGEDIHEHVLEMINGHIDDLIYSHINPNSPKELWYDDSQGLSPIKAIWQQLEADFTPAVLEALEEIDSYADSGFDALMHQVKESANKLYSDKEIGCGPEILREAERQIMLHVIDSKWVGHIHAMDSLKEGIHLQGYGQKDPLIEYKKESFDMFDTLLADIRRDTVRLLYHAQIVQEKKAHA
ncbi:MAG: hypothetical protein OXU45_08535 [Candidatus Melainabacteria bacterium]|nr:hypothetical protein [Candidatus Melainabacteria bacterium]